MWSAAWLRATAEDLVWLRDPPRIIEYLRTVRRLARRIDTDRRKVPVIVFQNGKVGSQSIFAVLASMRWPVLHTHHATHAWIKQAVDERRPGMLKSWAAFRLPEVRLAQHLARRAATTGLKLIVPFRDPVARSLSLCFHVNGGRISGPESPGERIARLRVAYDEHFWLWTDATPWEARAFSQRNHFDGTQPSWYERELRSGLRSGVDILASHLDFAEGYQVVSFGAVDVLFLKMEAMDRCLRVALKRFLGLELPPGPVERQYVQGDHLYRRFCDGAKISESRIERLLRTDVNAKLFTEQERVTLTERWLRDRP